MFEEEEEIQNNHEAVKADESSFDKIPNMFESDELEDEILIEESENESVSDDFKYDDLFPHYGGETTKQVQHRVVNTLTEIMNKEDHEVVLAVSHAGASMQFFSAFNDPAFIFNSGGLTNCCILHYTYDNNEFKFVEILRPEVK